MIVKKQDARFRAVDEVEHAFPDSTARCDGWLDGKKGELGERAAQSVVLVADRRGLTRLADALEKVANVYVPASAGQRLGRLALKVLVLRLHAVGEQPFDDIQVACGRKNVNCGEVCSSQVQPTIILPTVGSCGHERIPAADVRGLHRGTMLAEADHGLQLWQEGKE